MGIPDDEGTSSTALRPSSDADGETKAGVIPVSSPNQPSAPVHCKQLSNC